MFLLNFYFSQLRILKYPKNSSLSARFGLRDPKRSQRNLTPKSQIHILEKWITKFKGPSLYCSSGNINIPHKKYCNIIIPFRIIFFSKALTRCLVGWLRPVFSLKGTVSRDKFGVWWHVWLVLGLNRWLVHLFNFTSCSNDFILQKVYFSRLIRVYIGLIMLTSYFWLLITSGV